MQTQVTRQTVFKSLLWGILYLGLSYPSVAKTQESVDMAAVERAIEASKGYQGKVSCGKIDMGKKRYTFRIPEIAQWRFGIEYFGDSPWTKDGIAKKADPCLYDIKNVMMSFFWPSMKPYDGEYLYVGSDLKQHPNLVTGSLSRNSMDQNKPLAIKSENWIHSLKLQMIGYALESEIDADSIDDATVLAMGKYVPELGLYHYTFDQYINPSPNMIKNGLTNKRHNKREIFWNLDQDKRVIDLIVCEYLGLDVTKMTIKDTVCKLNTALYEYNVASLQIRFGGEYMQDWKQIRTATIKQYQAFITEKSVPHAILANSVVDETPPMMGSASEDHTNNAGHVNFGFNDEISNETIKIDMAQGYINIMQDELTKNKRDGDGISIENFELSYDQGYAIHKQSFDKNGLDVAIWSIYAPKWLPKALHDEH